VEGMDGDGLRALDRGRWTPRFPSNLQCWLLVFKCYELRTRLRAPRGGGGGE
jgi:hypothetical protein